MQEPNFAVDTFYPYVAVPYQNYDEGTRFFTQDGIIELSIDEPAKLFLILNECDGETEIDAIADYTELSFEEVAEIMAELYRNGLVVDAAGKYASTVPETARPPHFWRISTNEIYFVSTHVCPGRPIKRIWCRSFGELAPLFHASVSYQDGYAHTQYAGATSESAANAMFKATVEGYERWLSGQVRTDFYGNARELRQVLDVFNSYPQPAKYINPYTLFPLTEEQIRELNLTPFTEDLCISWTKGLTYDNRTVFLPSDIIYYGQKPSVNRIYFSHSSGIAAFSNFDEAERRAMAELIERDALMRNWFLQESPPTIAESSLPQPVQERIQFWRDQKRIARVHELPSEYGRVVLVTITSEQYPCFVSGAAATLTVSGTKGAITKALQEAECNLIQSLRGYSEQEITAEQVYCPAQHGAFYYFPERAELLHWLVGGPVVADFTPFYEREFGSLLHDLDVMTVNLSRGNDFVFPVVRVFSPKLVQINFGLHSAHYSYPFLRGKVHPMSLKLPHYFA